MSEKTTVFFCTLCEKAWQKLPEGAVRLTTKRGGNGVRTTYRFADNSVHVITTAKAEEKKDE